MRDLTAAARAAAMLLIPGGRARVALLVRREELEVRLAAVTGDLSAAHHGPLADEAARRQAEHARFALATTTRLDPLYGLESVYRDVIAGDLEVGA